MAPGEKSPGVYFMHSPYKNCRAINTGMDFLIEHNVVNRDEIAAFVQQYIDQCTHQTAKEWFRVVAGRYLEKEDRYNAVMPPGTRLINGKKPDWLDAAIARGDDLRIFNRPEEMEPLFEHLVDYFNWLATDERGLKVLEDQQRFMRLTVQSAIEKSREWVNQQSRLAAKENVPGAEVVHEDGPFYWIEAKSSALLFREGKILQNCLGQGNYHDEVLRGTAKVYIMRDVKNYPHVAIRLTNNGGWEVAEVKGKQNEPPVGRYVEITKRFLNWLNVPIGGGKTDLTRMGLRADAEGKIVGLKDQNLGTILWSKDNVEVVKDGTAHWFLRNGETFAKLEIDSTVRASNVGFGKPDELAKTVRPYVQEFLNQMEGGAPPPGRDAGSRSVFDAALNSRLNLRYNYANKKYGSPYEVGTEVMSEGAVRVLLWQGDHQDSRQYHVFSGKKQLLAFHMGGSGGANMINWMSFGDEGSSEVTEETFSEGHLELFCGIFNHLEAFDKKEYVQHRIPEIMYTEEKGFGLVSDMADKLWSKGPVAAYRWYRDGMITDKGKPRYEIAFMRGDRIWFSIESSHYGSATIDINHDLDLKEKNKIATTLADFLNNTNDIDEVKEKYEFENVGVFFNKKWGTREQVSETFHKFDTGASISILPRSANKDEYILMMPDGRPVFAFVIMDKRHVMDAKNIGNVKRRALLGPYFKWLFNTLRVHPTDVPKNDHYYHGDSSHQSIFAMGLFHDTRSDEWKLTQDGKTIYAGKDWRAITFRNRIMIWDDSDGIIGWITKEGDNLKEVRSMQGFSDRQMLKYISELTKNTDLWFGGRDGAINTADLRQHGNHRNTDNEYSHAKEISHINDTHGKDTEFLPLKAGWGWHHLPFDEEYARAEHSEDKNGKLPRLHGERYTLRDSKDNSWMRVGFTDDGYLENVTWQKIVENQRTKAKDTEIEHGTKDMNEKLIPMLTALLEKTGYRLTPQQSADLRVYLKNGKYLSMARDKALMAFASGHIDFEDGHSFKRDRYDANKWSLFYKNPETNENHEMAKVELSNDGLESIKFSTPEIKRRPKLYTPYLHKLMDIFDRTIGE